MSKVIIRRTPASIAKAYGRGVADEFAARTHDGPAIFHCPVTGCHLTVTQRRLFFTVRALGYGYDRTDLTEFMQVHKADKYDAAPMH